MHTMRTPKPDPTPAGRALGITQVFDAPIVIVGEDKDHVAMIASLISHAPELALALSAILDSDAYLAAAETCPALTLYRAKAKDLLLTIAKGADMDPADENGGIQ